jgi:hypothetical protein
LTEQGHFCLILQHKNQIFFCQSHPVKMKAFFTPQLLTHLVVSVISGISVAVTGFISESVHLPFFVNLLFSIGLGWLEPDKGWLLAITQVVAVLLAAYLISTYEPIEAFKSDVAGFTAMLGFLPTLAGALIGAFFKRTFSGH